MKKLVFSAIALVAFTATSMAGEIKVTKKASKKTLIKKNCETIKGLAYNLAVSEGADDCTAEAYADIVYSNCMK